MTARNVVDAIAAAAALSIEELDALVAPPAKPDKKTSRRQAAPIDPSLPETPAPPDPPSSDQAPGAPERPLGVPSEIDPPWPADDFEAAAGPPGAPAPPPDEEASESQTSRAGEKDETRDRRKGGGREATARRAGEKAPASDAALDKRLAFFPLTDLGNAERFRERIRDKFIYCAAIGWFYWDGKRWNPIDADAKVQIAAHMCVRSIQDEAAAIEGTGLDFVVGTKSKGSGKDKTEEELLYSMMLRSHGRDSETNSKLNHLADQARSYVVLRPAELDANPLAFNLDNGTIMVDMAAEGLLRFKPHDPADLITKISPVKYDKDAVCPLFDKFLAEVQPKDTTRRLLACWSGYSLTGDAREQVICILYGGGQNGKSVFEKLRALIMGDYCETLPIETFITDGPSRNAGQATPDLALLPGVRALQTSEPKKGSRVDEGLIKIVTGGEKIQVRHLNKGFFKFEPVFKLTLSCNHRPTITGVDQGIWRRIRLVPWPVQIPIERQDKQLFNKIAVEASGVLNWALAGLVDWLRNGLTLGDDVAEATAEYRRDSDQLGRFLEECTEYVVGERVQSTVIHGVFNAWSKANSLNEWKGRTFSMAMSERGMVKDKNSVIFFLNLKLTKRRTDFENPDGTVRRLDGGDRSEVNPPPHDEIPGSTAF